MLGGPANDNEMTHGLMGHQDIMHVQAHESRQHDLRGSIDHQ